jgi:hypothetical protein
MFISKSLKVWLSNIFKNFSNISRFFALVPQTTEIFIKSLKI